MPIGRTSNNHIVGLWSARPSRRVGRVLHDYYYYYYFYYDYYYYAYYYYYYYCYYYYDYYYYAISTHVLQLRPNGAIMCIISVMFLIVIITNIIIMCSY